MKNIKWLLLSIIIIIADQLSKSMLVDNLAYGSTQTILPFFNMVHAHNRGAAFSMLSTASGWQDPLFIGIAASVSVALIVWLVRLPRTAKLEAAAISLILGGAVGNLYDRVTLGYVIDFLDVHIDTWHWPAFNIADSAITIGALLLAYNLFFKSAN